MNETLENRIAQLREHELDLELWESLYNLCNTDEKRKLEAIKNLYDKSEKEVIKIVKCKPKTLSRWLDTFLAEGLEKLVKTSINKYEEFDKIYHTLNLESNEFDLVEIVDRIENEVIKKYSKPLTQGSRNNCRGTWHELAFIMEAHRSILQSTENLYLVKMGSETSIKFWEIYQKESRQKYDLLLNMFKKREEQIFIRCSTPDFVVISRDIIQDSSSYNILQNPSPPLKEINELYKVIKNKCLPHQVKGFISLKTSNRPDRRYQILLEANVTKFASRYIHEREHRLRYDVFGESNPSDRQVFCAPLMFTLPQDGSNINSNSIERAINTEVTIKSRQELDEHWKRYEEIIERDREGKAVAPDEEFENDNLDL
jgi:Cfr10I/Bse634I restriction endonuclease